MTVAAIPARDGIISFDPTAAAIAVGIASHQWGPGLLRPTRPMEERLPPAALAALAVPWALLTSATEWFVLVPHMPFWQPILTLQQPNWIGFWSTCRPP